jgi:hypothetical protein
VNPQKGVAWRAYPYSQSSLIQQASEKGHYTASLRNARSGNVKRRLSFRAEESVAEAT